MNTLPHNISFDIVANYTSLFEFDFWDILFVGQNQSNEWIIGSLARDDKEKNVLHHYYLIINEHDLKEYLELKISYRDLFPLAKSIFRTLRDINENIITEKKVLYENLKDENMPRQNSFCPDYDERHELLKLLQKPKPILKRVLGKRKEKILEKF
jgi:hypothetical protein